MRAAVLVVSAASLAALAIGAGGRPPTSRVAARAIAASASPEAAPTPAVADEDASASPAAAPTPAVTEEDVARLIARNLLVPVAGVDAASLQDTYGDARSGHAHEALDIAAPLGTPVAAVDDGVVAKLFTSVPGGLTVYQFDPARTYAFYYAHLDRYTAGLHEGQMLRRGDVIGYVGATGNAGDTPHLHFAIFKLGPDARWWRGTPINPYPTLVRPR